MGVTTISVFEMCDVDAGLARRVLMLVDAVGTAMVLTTRTSVPRYTSTRGVASGRQWERKSAGWLPVLLLLALSSVALAQCMFWMHALCGEIIIVSCHAFT